MYDLYVLVCTQMQLKCLSSMVVQLSKLSTKDNFNSFEEKKNGEKALFGYVA